MRSLPIFHTEDDRQTYVTLLAQATTRHGVQVWAWCLMTNHVHLVLVPASPTALAEAMGWTHRHYTRRINFRERVRGHLFQERFHSFPIQTDQHLLAVSRYVERNPVRAKLVNRAEAYPWSSARPHVLGVPDPLVSASPLLAMVPAWGLSSQKGMLISIGSDSTYAAVGPLALRRGFKPWKTNSADRCGPAEVAGRKDVPGK